MDNTSQGDDLEESNFAQKAAKASWQIFIVAMVILFGSQLVPKSPLVVVIRESVVFLLLVIGLTCAVVALIGMTWSGPKGVVWQALAGVALNGLVLFIFMTNFIAARERARERAEEARQIQQARQDKPEVRTGYYQTETIIVPSLQTDSPTLLGIWKAQTPQRVMIWAFTTDQMFIVQSNGMRLPVAYEVDYTQTPIWLNLHTPGEVESPMPLIVEFLSGNSFRALGPAKGSDKRPANFNDNPPGIITFNRIDSRAN